MSALTISEVVDVVFEKYPKLVKWRGREIEIKKLGLHHTFKNGNILYHVFSVVSDSLFLKLQLDTKHLQWKLEEIYEKN